MPFTFSHPAIVLPLNKISGRALSLTGLIAGSITPDFEYFIRMHVRIIFSHTIPGLFWFDVPLGLLLTFLYHLVVRTSLINNLPEALYKKLGPFKNFDWVAYFKKNWIMVIFSILIGAASHIFWDGFTHPSGYFVDNISFLQTKIIFGKLTVPIYNILQQLSSLMGGIVVILAIITLPDSERERSEITNNYWVSILITSAVIFVIRLSADLQIQLYGDVIVTIISAFLIGVILTPLIIQALRFIAT